MKDLSIQIDELIEDVYWFGDFHSADTFAEEVYRVMKKEGISIGYIDYVDQRIKEVLDY